MDIGEIFATVITLVITVYVVFEVISILSRQNPEFAQYGWLIFGALLFGAVAFLKFGLFGNR